MDSLPTRVLDDLFSRMHAILGAKWLDVFNGADLDIAREEWARALAGFMPVELSHGLDALAQRRFPPTLGEFACLCRPCLDHEWAFHHAHSCLMQRDKGETGDWSHPAEWRAASTLSLEVRRGDYASVRARWKVELEKQLKAGWGDMPPAPPLRIKDDNQGTATSEVAIRERTKIAKMLGRLKEGDDAA
jgi:hypothetical protein